MATMLKMQLNTPATVTRDTTVDVVNAVTGERRQVKPFLDGTVSLSTSSTTPSTMDSARSSSPR